MFTSLLNKRIYPANDSEEIMVNRIASLLPARNRIATVLAPAGSAMCSGLAFVGATSPGQVAHLYALAAEAARQQVAARRRYRAATSAAAVHWN